MLTSASTPTNKLRLQSPRDISSTALLWRAVLSQAIKDIYSGGTGERRDVILWMKSRDFDEVCDHACVDPENMRIQMRNLAEMPQMLAKKYGKPLRNCIMDGVHND